MNVFHLGYLRAQYIGERPALFQMTTTSGQQFGVNLFLTSDAGAYFFQKERFKAPIEASLESTLPVPQSDKKDKAASLEGNRSTAENQLNFTCSEPIFGVGDLKFQPWVNIRMVEKSLNFQTEAQQVAQISSSFLDNIIDENTGTDAPIYRVRPGLLTSLAYNIGIVVGVLGLLKIKDHVENPTDTPLQHGAIRLIAGGALFDLPIVFETMQTCLGEGLSVTAAELNKVNFSVK